MNHSQEDDVFDRIYARAGARVLAAVTTTYTTGKEDNIRTLTGRVTAAAKTVCTDLGLDTTQHAPAIAEWVFTQIRSTLPESYLDTGGWHGGSSPDPEERKQQRRAWVVELFGDMPKPLVVAWLKKLLSDG